MKKLCFVSILFFLLNTLNAQEKRFEFRVGGDLGFSKLKLNNQSLNASTNGAFLHLSYNLKFLDIESGLEYISAQTNFNSSGSSFFVENKYLSIPVGVNTKLELKKSSENINSRYIILLGAGLYTNYLMESELENINKQANVGWNFGVYAKFGIRIQANDVYHLDVGMKAQQDFSDIEKDDISVRQERRNVMYLNFGIRL